MKIVLTGASGFIGGAFLRHMLAQGPFLHRMICLSSSDAGQEKLLAQWPDLEVYALRSIHEKSTRDAIEGADALIHCAWSTVPRTAATNPGKDLLENVYYGLTLMEMAADLGVGRFIFLSSGGTVYGMGHHEPMREDHLTVPLNAYGVSKLSFEHYLRTLTTGRMRHIILRPGNIYGRASDPLRPQGVIEHWMQRIIRGEALDIWSSRSVIRDFVHIDDLLEVLKRALTYEGAHSLFNVGSGKGTSLDELLQLIGELAGKELEATWQEDDATALSDVNILDPTRLRQEFGSAPEKPLVEGLRQLWNALMAEHQRKIGSGHATGDH
jgi:UDP-glucose 4-epimerase